MRAEIITCLAATLFATAVPAQTPATENQRTYRINHAESVKEMHEIAVAIRTLADIRQVSVDEPRATMSLAGNGEQMQLADWLFSQFDNPAAPAPHEYPVSMSGNDVVRVFRLSHADTPQDLNEVAVLVRTIANLRMVLTYTRPRMITLRGSPQQLAYANWLIADLDTPDNRKPPAPAHEYRAPDGEVARVFYVNVETNQRLNEIAIQIRKETGIKRLMTYNSMKAIAAAGTAEQIALADRMIQERDR